MNLSNDVVSLLSVSIGAVLVVGAINITLSRAVGFFLELLSDD